MRSDNGITRVVGAVQRRHLAVPLTVLAMLALSTMMCLSFGGSSSDTTDTTSDVSATLEALQQQLADAQATAAAVGAAVPPTAAAPAGPEEPTQPEPAPAGARVEDSFDSDAGNFLLGEGMQIENGALYLGPFEQCTEDVAAFDTPIDCNAVCLTCGANVANYRMQVDLSFVEGLSDKGFGVLLRFVDQDGDGMLDREDYYLGLSLRTFDSQWWASVHIPDAVKPWYLVKAGPAGLRGQNSPNRMVVTASNNGRLIDVFLNDKRLVKFTADAPQPGETLIEDWAESGAVGLAVSGRRVRARYDNFVFEPLP